MANMRILIRIVFIIFIVNGIDCLGRVCDDCCDCFKEEIEEYEEIKEEGNITAESLVNNDWIKAKENLVLKIFKKKGNNDFPSKNNGEKISIKSDEKGNPKIVYQNLEGEKYAFFEIKTNTDKTVYLYCSDVESSENNRIFGSENNGIFEGTDHISISIIACDTTNVKNMGRMFYDCENLTELEIVENFNTTNVKNMGSMFSRCNSLTKLDLENFNTTKVTYMRNMFSECSSLTDLKFGDNFNTTNVTDMSYMFSGCKNLKELKFEENFNTEKVRDMECMFCGCSSLTELNL